MTARAGCLFRVYSPSHGVIPSNRRALEVDLRGTSGRSFRRRRSLAGPTAPRQSSHAFVRVQLARDGTVDDLSAVSAHWTDRVDCGEDSIAELCRREGIAQNLYYRWSKDFLEAGKKRLAGDTARAATSDEVHDLRREATALKEVVADLTLENRLLKKSVTADGEDGE